MEALERALIAAQGSPDHAIPGLQPLLMHAIWEACTSGTLPKFLQLLGDVAERYRPYATFDRALVDVCFRGLLGQLENPEEVEHLGLAVHRAGDDEDEDEEEDIQRRRTILWQDFATGPIAYPRMLPAVFLACVCSPPALGVLALRHLTHLVLTYPDLAVRVLESPNGSSAADFSWCKPALDLVHACGLAIGLHEEDSRQSGRWRRRNRTSGDGESRFSPRSSALRHPSEVSDSGEFRAGSGSPAALATHALRSMVTLTLNLVSSIVAHRIKAARGRAEIIPGLLTDLIVYIGENFEDPWSPEGICIAQSLLELVVNKIATKSVLAGLRNDSVSSLWPSILAVFRFAKTASYFRLPSSVLERLGGAGNAGRLDRRATSRLSRVDSGAGSAIEHPPLLGSADPGLEGLSPGMLGVLPGGALLLVGQRLAHSLREGLMDLGFGKRPSQEELMYLDKPELKLVQERHEEGSSILKFFSQLLELWEDVNLRRAIRSRDHRLRVELAVLDLFSQRGDPALRAEWRQRDRAFQRDQIAKQQRRDLHHLSPVLGGRMYWRVLGVGRTVRQFLAVDTGTVPPRLVSRDVLVARPAAKEREKEEARGAAAGQQEQEQPEEADAEEEEEEEASTPWQEVAVLDRTTNTVAGVPQEGSRKSREDLYRYFILRVRGSEGFGIKLASDNAADMAALGRLLEHFCQPNVERRTTAFDLARKIQATWAQKVFAQSLERHLKAGSRMIRLNTGAPFLHGRQNQQQLLPAEDFEAASVVDGVLQPAGGEGAPEVSVIGSRRSVVGRFRKNLLVFPVYSNAHNYWQDGPEAARLVPSLLCIDLEARVIVYDPEDKPVRLRFTQIATVAPAKKDDGLCFFTRVTREGGGEAREGLIAHRVTWDSDRDELILLLRGLVFDKPMYSAFGWPGSPVYQEGLAWYKTRHLLRESYLVLTEHRLFIYESKGTRDPCPRPYPRIVIFLTQAELAEAADQQEFTSITVSGGKSGNRGSGVYQFKFWSDAEMDRWHAALQERIRAASTPSQRAQAERRRQKRERKLQRRGAAADPLEEEEEKQKGGQPEEQPADAVAPGALAAEPNSGAAADPHEYVFQLQQRTIGTKIEFVLIQSLPDRSVKAPVMSLGKEFWLGLPDLGACPADDAAAAAGPGDDAAAARLQQQWMVLYSPRPYRFQTRYATPAPGTVEVDRRPPPDASPQDAYSRACRTEAFELWLGCADPETYHLWRDSLSYLAQERVVTGADRASVVGALQVRAAESRRWDPRQHQIDLKRVCQPEGLQFWIFHDHNYYSSSQLAAIRLDFAGSGRSNQPKLVARAVDGSSAGEPAAPWTDLSGPIEPGSGRLRVLELDPNSNHITLLVLSLPAPLLAGGGGDPAAATSVEVSLVSTNQLDMLLLRRVLEHRLGAESCESDVADFDLPTVWKVQELGVRLASNAPLLSRGSPCLTWKSSGRLDQPPIQVHLTLSRTLRGGHYELIADAMAGSSRQLHRLRLPERRSQNSMLACSSYVALREPAAGRQSAAAGRPEDSGDGDLPSLADDEDEADLWLVVAVDNHRSAAVLTFTREQTEGYRLFRESLAYLCGTQFSTDSAAEAIKSLKFRFEDLEAQKAWEGSWTARLSARLRTNSIKQALRGLIKPLRSRKSAAPPPPPAPVAPSTIPPTADVELQPNVGVVSASVSGSSPEAPTGSVGLQDQDSDEDVSAGLPDLTALDSDEDDPALCV